VYFVCEFEANLHLRRLCLVLEALSEKYISLGSRKRSRVKITVEVCQVGGLEAYSSNDLG